MEELSALRGLPVRSSDGDKIGSVEEVFYDEQTRQPEWIGIGTGFFGNKRVLVPVEGASFENSGVTVRYSKEQVKDAPDVDADEISQELEQELYAYYGWATLSSARTRVCRRVLRRARATRRKAS